MKRNRAKNNKKMHPPVNPTTDTVASDPAIIMMDTAQIIGSPFNYRAKYSDQALQEFAAGIKPYGILQPLTVRPIDEGRYELVAGERRLRAARLAGIAKVPVIVRPLRDHDVQIIQLLENMQRENPHPMEEARGIAKLRDHHKTIDEIARLLGKSKAYIYLRLKLTALIAPFQEMFLANALEHQQAIDIATLSAPSQQEFYDERCTDWQRVTPVVLGNLSYYLSQYTYNLKKAPFNTKDKKLVPNMGACTGCPFNSASLKTLFPEYAKEAICTNKECYRSKCTATFVKQLTALVEAFHPVAVLTEGKLPTEWADTMNTNGSLSILSQFDTDDVTILRTPEEPCKEEYVYGDSEDTEQEEADYQEALQEYAEELEHYNEQATNGTFQQALLLKSNSCAIVLFNAEPPKRNHCSEEKVTAKQVQAAIKEGTATPDLLQAEIDRLQDREARATQLDSEKIQLTVHQLFSEQIKEIDHQAMITAAEQLAVRLLVYQSLDYSARYNIHQQLFYSGIGCPEDVLQRLQGLSDAQYGHLIRTAVSTKPDSKMPNHLSGQCLYQLAVAAGINTPAIEREQAEKKEQRLEKLHTKIAGLQKRINKITTGAPPL